MKFIIYPIRMACIILFVGLVGIIGTIFSLFRPFNPNNLYVVCQFLKYGIQILGIEIEIRNRKFFDQFPAVIVSNHQENMDIFVGASVVPDRTVSIGKRSIIFVPLFGLFYWLSGNILINRKNKKSAFGTMDEAAKQIREKKTSVWILPEGTRSKGRGVLPFKKGAFVTAIKAKVPLYTVAFSSYHEALDFGRWKSGKIIVEVMPKIETNHFSMENVNELKSIAEEIIRKKVTELDLEIKSDQHLSRNP